MKTLTALQKHAIYGIESMVGDLWINILNLARKPHDEKNKIIKLAGDWHRIKSCLNDIATELDCRWAIDLGPCDTSDVIGLVRIYLLDKGKSVVEYKGELINFANANWKLTAWLEEDFQEHFEELNNNFEKLSEVISDVLKEENSSKLDEFVDDIMDSIFLMNTINDFIVGRFGDCDTGIILYQNQSDGKINVSIYDGIGERVPLQL